MKRFLLGLIFCLNLLSLAFAVPNYVTYQGRILNNGVPYTGVLQMRIKLFDSQTGGIMLFDSGNFFANVVNGIYETSIPFNQFLGNPNVYMELIIGNASDTTRVKINSHAFAMLASSLSPYGNTTETVNLDNNGNIGIGTTANANVLLKVNGGLKVAYDVVEEAGVIRWNPNNSKLEFYDGSSWVALN